MSNRGRPLAKTNTMTLLTTPTTLQPPRGGAQPANCPTTISNESRLRHEVGNVYRNIVDFEFSVKITDPALPARKLVVEALRFLRKNDPTVKIFSADRSEHFEVPEELPRESEALQAKLQYRKIRNSNRHQSLIFSLYPETKLLMITHRRDSARLKTLQDRENLYMRPHTLGTPVATVLGLLAKVHPRVTHFQTLERNLKESLKGASYDPNERKQWEQTLDAHEKLAFKRDNAPVPPLRVFRGTKRVETGAGKRLIEVMNIKVATKHKHWVFHLLCRASEHEMLPYASKFIPTSIHPKSQQY